MSRKAVIFLSVFLSAMNLQAQSGKGLAVVELFTSEGCSSCPPADEVLSEIAKTYKTNVYPIEFHVDYRDSLGWQDPFSQARYFQRQRAYGQSRVKREAHLR
ncbi:MAG: DUF1223 domain-containing protein [Bacteroidota bacterium]|nr:DUF1223 domain-containing protein [Bacteroidota bacterium]MDP4213467.1 DUF1223 domain-containing protein [Bacteroidota bacterium]MDP4250053.1 DUF1223 domain-containing protein [Bacteroidota bacterium]